MAVFAAAFIAGCASKLPTSSDLAKTGLNGIHMNEGEIAEGRANFVEHCDSCHEFVYPAERTPVEWDAIFRGHYGKTSLSNVQYGRVRAYVIAVSRESAVDSAKKQ